MRLPRINQMLRESEEIPYIEISEENKLIEIESSEFTDKPSDINEIRISRSSYLTQEDFRETQNENPIEILKSAEINYRRAVRNIPLVKTFCPTIPSLLILIAYIIYPELGIALFVINFLNKASGGKIPSPQNAIEEHYVRTLLRAQLGEQKNDQGKLISKNKGQLVTTILHQLPVVSEACWMADTISGLSNQQIPSLTQTLTDKANECLPQNMDLSALATKGNCFGLVIVGYATKKAGLQRLFIKTLNNVMDKAQSILNSGLSKEEKELVKNISDVQKKQEKQFMIPCPGRQDRFVDVKEQRQEFFGIYEESKHFDQAIYDLVKKVIDGAVQNPGDLIGFTIRKRGAAHIMGIVAEQNFDGIKIEINDPNFPMKPFTSHKSAVNALKGLLLLKYESYFQKNDFANIELKVYQAKVLELNRQNRESFFRAEPEIPSILYTNTDRFFGFAREYFAFKNALVIRQPVEESPIQEFRPFSS